MQLIFIFIYLLDTVTSWEKGFSGSFWPQIYGSNKNPINSNCSQTEGQHTRLIKSINTAAFIPYLVLGAMMFLWNTFWPCFLGHCRGEEKGRGRTIDLKHTKGNLRRALLIYGPDNLSWIKARLSIIPKGAQHIQLPAINSKRTKTFLEAGPDPNLWIGELREEYTVLSGLDKKHLRNLK